MVNKYEQAAERFCAAVKELADKPENLSNLECYLSHHFGPWMEKYANTPDGLTYEMEVFAKMEI